MTIDGHAFHSGKCWLQASESTEARQAEDANENFAHFSFPIRFVSQSRVASIGAQSRRARMNRS